MIAGLPKIVRFLGTDDAPGAECPHCGATGRWISWFITADGQRRGAMRGCLSLFPVSRVAIEEKRLAEKQARYAASGWSLNRADKLALAAIEDYYTGRYTEAVALSFVSTAKGANVARFRASRGVSR